MRSCFLQSTVLLLLTVLAACKEPLYSDLSQNEANDMIAVLTAARIEANRTPDKDGRYSVNVSETDVGAAVTILKSHGMPRENFSSLGDVFDASGLIGTPFEERARYMFALSQELSRTIADINGIDSARVHIVLPEQDRFAKQQAMASASVAIYTSETFDLAAHAATIKQLVAFGVPDLSYDKVVLARFDTGGVRVVRTAPASEFGSAQAAVTDGDSLPIKYASLAAVGSPNWSRQGSFLVLLIAGICAVAISSVLLVRVILVKRRDPAGSAGCSS